MAGWPYAAARSASLSMLHAPSRSEYSEWTWRCATVGELIGEATICARSDVNFRAARILRRSECRACRSTRSLGCARRVANACGIYTDLGGFAWARPAGVRVEWSTRPAGVLAGGVAAAVL